MHHEDETTTIDDGLALVAYGCRMHAEQWWALAEAIQRRDRAAALKALRALDELSESGPLALGVARGAVLPK